MIDINCDVIIIGISISGVAAGIELAYAGRYVLFVENPSDSISLRDIPIVRCNPLVPDDTNGELFSHISMSKLVKCGCKFYYPPQINFHEDHSKKNFYITLDDQGTMIRINYKCLIYAPNGKEELIERMGDIHQYFGKRVFVDASSDAPALKDATIALIGRGYRGIEQLSIIQIYTQNIIYYFIGDFSDFEWSLATKYFPNTLDILFAYVRIEIQEAMISNQKNSVVLSYKGGWCHVDAIF